LTQSVKFAFFIKNMPTKPRKHALKYAKKGRQYVQILHILKILPFHEFQKNSFLSVTRTFLALAVSPFISYHLLGRLHSYREEVKSPSFSYIKRRSRVKPGMTSRPSPSPKMRIQQKNRATR